MTDETKKLFDAPWYVFSSPDDEITVIENESGRVLAELDDVKTANRLARLPELYDAFAEVMYEGCGNCCRAHDPSLDPTFDCFVDKGCPFNQRDCFFGQHWAILRKVRDGK